MLSTLSADISLCIIIINFINGVMFMCSTARLVLSTPLFGPPILVLLSGTTMLLLPSAPEVIFLLALTWFTWWLLFLYLMVCVLILPTSLDYNCLVHIQNFDFQIGHSILPTLFMYLIIQILPILMQPQNNDRAFSWTASVPSFTTLRVYSQKQNSLIIIEWANNWYKS